jgi:hypothetical protein
MTMLLFWTVTPWRWGQYVSPKRYLPTSLHGVTIQNNIVISDKSWYINDRPRWYIFEKCQFHVKYGLEIRSTTFRIAYESHSENFMDIGQAVSKMKLADRLSDSTVISFQLCVHFMNVLHRRHNLCSINSLPDNQNIYLFFSTSSCSTLNLFLPVQQWISMALFW